MRLDDRLADAEHGRAADLVRVERRLERVELVLDGKSGHLGLEVFHENALELARHVLDAALDALEQHVAGETVRDDDVHVAAEHLRRLDVADKADAAGGVRCLEQRERLVLELGTLVILGAVAQQADARRGDAEHGAGIVTAHIGKLQQVFRRAVGIGAAVDEHDARIAVRQHGSQRRAADAVDALDDERGAGEQCAGAAGGDDRVALAVTQHVERDRHGSVLLAAGSRAGVVVHGDDFARVDDLELGLLIAQAGLNGGALADEHDLRAQLLLRVHRALDDLIRGEVTAHCVHKNSHR